MKEDIRSHWTFDFVPDKYHNCYSISLFDKAFMQMELNEKINTAGVSGVVYTEFYIHPAYTAQAISKQLIPRINRLMEKVKENLINTPVIVVSPDKRIIQIGARLFNKENNNFYIDQPTIVAIELNPDTVHCLPPIAI